MNYMIRLANASDIDWVIGITKICASHMISNGIYQWNEYYPSRDAFETDVSRKELFVLEIHDEIIGCIVISAFMDNDYIPVKWLTPNAQNIYIHRLAIHPEHQGKGYAQELMTFAENFSREKNYLSIRLDTYSMNKRNQKFYELRGYKRLGDIYFPNQSDYPFYCYELVF